VLTKNIITSKAKRDRITVVPMSYGGIIYEGDITWSIRNVG